MNHTMKVITISTKQYSTFTSSPKKSASVKHYFTKPTVRLHSRRPTVRSARALVALRSMTQPFPVLVLFCQGSYG